jgi:predicted HicB family RNase H-like nuclease
MAAEQKTATIMLRVRPSLKAKAEAAAEAEGRSLTNYIERLIETAAGQRGGRKR